nr:AMP dependent ligase [Hymenolepis microstoma]
MHDSAIPPSGSIITGHLTETFAKSLDGLFKEVQLGDCLSGIAEGSAAQNTAVISFKPMEGSVETIEEISFAELQSRVMKLAFILKELLSPSLQQRKVDLETADSQSKTFVVAYINAGINRVYIQLACMYLRLAYIPMDSNLPNERINFVCNSFEPIAFITDDINVTIENIEIPKFTVNELLEKSNALNRTANEPLFRRMKNPLLLVLFTSGSTSPIPKGILLRNGQMANRLSWQWSAESPLAGIEGPSLIKTSCLFVDSFTEMFGPLLGGRPIVVSGTSQITCERLVADIEILKRLVSQYQITQLTSVPTQLELWLNQMDDEGMDFKSLRAIVSSGQVLPYNLALKIFEGFGKGNLRLINLYGSTEVAGDITAFTFNSKEEVSKAAIKLPVGSFVLPVGKPISNIEIYVAKSEIGSSAKVVPMGSEGDISASGAGILLEEPILNFSDKKPVPTLSRNYLTKLSCFPRLFQTGDVGFICPLNGNLYITGRVDDVVKVHGIKISVGNIDQILAAIDRSSGKFASLGATVTLALEKGETGSQLVCFYKTDGDKTFTNMDLATVVATHLTSFLHVIFVEVPTFPIMKHSGKIDKVKLKQNYKDGVYETRNIVRKQETNEKRESLRRIFAKTLALPETSVENGEPVDDADFFLIGGNSISAAIITSELRKKGYRVNMNLFAENQKIGDLLDALTNATDLKAKSTSNGRKVPFIREFQPGKTFASDSELDNKWRNLIADILADSFTEFEPMARMLNLNKKTVHEITLGRLKQFEEVLGVVFVAGFTQSDPNGPLNNLFSEVSAVTLGYPLETPKLSDVSDPLYEKIEEAFEICDSRAKKLEDPSKCFSSGLLGARRINTGNDMIQLVILLEEFLINAAKRMGFNAIRSINTSITTRTMSDELGYVRDCTIDIAEIFRELGVKTNKTKHLVDVATKFFD